MVTRTCPVAAPGTAFGVIVMTEAAVSTVMPPATPVSVDPAAQLTAAVFHVRAGVALVTVKVAHVGMTVTTRTLTPYTKALAGMVIAVLVLAAAAMVVNSVLYFHPLRCPPLAAAAPME